MIKTEDDLCHIYDMSLFNTNDFDVLLHEILKQTRSLLNSEAGSIYIREDDALAFNVFQNDAMSYENIYRQFYSLKDTKLPLSEQEKYLAVQSYLSRKVLVIDDVYEAKDYDFLGVKEYDQRFDYKTRSIITAPIIHPIENKTLGVLQLLNKKVDDNFEVYTKKDQELLSMASSFIALSISKAQTDIEKLKRLNIELEQANEKLIKRVEDEIRESERKSSIIYHQSKLVSMGEMIGNIAHQWRQPLSAISTIAGGLSFNLEYGEFKKDESLKALDRIVDTTKHLSQTIDDFRNFYKIDKTMKNFNLADNILKSISITQAALNENRIEIICDLDEDLEFYGYDNELKQAILNIIQNAKDAIMENLEEHSRFIFITLKKEDNDIVIQIKDNAKGIPEEIIEKIFEQNFTTKEGNGGTGIGLYMTKEIIEKHMDGTLSVMNEEYVYDNKKCKGALFTLKFSS